MRASVQQDDQFRRLRFEAIATTTFPIRFGITSTRFVTRLAK